MEGSVKQTPLQVFQARGFNTGNLGAYKTIGRAAEKNVRKPLLDFGFNSSFHKLRSCCLLPLTLSTPSPGSGNSRELVNMATSVMQH